MKPLVAILGPTATGKSLSTLQDQSVPVVLSGSDPNGDPLTFSVVSTPTHGSLSGSAPNPPHVLPSRPATAPPPTDIGSCRVFKPGQYTTAPILATKNYFTSGVYVFKNIGDWSTNRKDIYGGAQAPDFDIGTDRAVARLEMRFGVFYRMNILDPA